ncbi:phage major capsid family protein [Mogibacterium sp. CM50]|jgi:Phage capsid family.|uniref:phage major capsid family protein n=1 Tax=Mogibacterium sp. CM50 TaxID=936375 RepID=UPI00027C35E1|nr:phage major capsid protein [Mogibacterium sp. CM50]EJU21654.1 phage capsid family [Mogibacterium sp. CM50]
MADVLQMSTMFEPEVVEDLFTKVKGHSTLAQLSAQIPIAFTGNSIFVFSMDDEVNLVAEGGKKSAGKLKAEPVKVAPLKVEYGARVSDEFVYASEEKKLDILTAFNDGYSKKVARGLDIMAMHGINPRDKQVSSLIGTNSFDTATGVTKVDYVAGTEEAVLETAALAIGEYDVTGFALSKNFGSELAKIKVNGVPQYPEFRFGASPAALGGTACNVNSTVSYANNAAGYVGDFASAFKWGFAKEIPLEIIPYGDPDQSGKDLKAYNQVYLRAETYIGWGILDPTAFARIIKKG